MNKTIKAPATVRELGDLAGELGMTISEVWDLLTDALGDKWWEHSLGEVTFTFAPAEAPKRPTPPAGYELAEGCADLWIGEDVVNRGWIITPAWNAVTNTHSLELWTANHEPPRYANMSPADAFDLAADLITAARAVETASNSAGN